MAKLLSTQGTLTFDPATGFVTDASAWGYADSEGQVPGGPYGVFGEPCPPPPFKVDIDEWRLRYPGEEVEGEHDILDFGFWYYDDRARKRNAKYEPPSESWRLQREAGLKEVVV